MEKWKNKVTGPICDNLNKSGWGWTNFCSLSGNIRSLGLGTVVEHSTCYVIKKRSTVQQFSGTVNTATKRSYWSHFWRRLFMKRFPSRNQSTLQNCEKSKSNKGSSCTDGWGLLERVRWRGSFEKCISQKYVGCRVTVWFHSFVLTILSFFRKAFIWRKWIFFTAGGGINSFSNLYFLKEAVKKP